MWFSRADGGCGRAGATKRRAGTDRPSSAQELRKQRSTVTVEASPARRAEILDRVVIRFAGDSGDGMQLVGDRFTELSAVFGNDLATLPNFPAEIRAPAGTI